MTVKKRTGKPSAGVLNTKRDYATDNACLLAQRRAQAFEYKRQPTRSGCKACGKKLPGVATVALLGVEYFACPACGHLSGGHLDTRERAARMYAGNGSGHDAHYVDADHETHLRRVAAIYHPKAEWLRDVVGRGVEVLDVGAGAGHFVEALLDAGIRAYGIEVSPTLAGCSIHVGAIDPGEEGARVRKTGAGVVSMIGVLEHLPEPHEMIQAIADNPKIKHVCLSVPMFGVGTFLEVAFPGVFPRNLGGGHTHLFSDKSLDAMLEGGGFRRVAEWRFGSDMLGLLRQVQVAAVHNGASDEAVDRFADVFVPMLDELQGVIDRHGQSSELHAVFERVS